MVPLLVVATRPLTPTTCDVYSIASPSSRPGPALLNTLPVSWSGREPLNARVQPSSSVCSWSQSNERTCSGEKSDEGEGGGLGARAAAAAAAPAAATVASARFFLAARARSMARGDGGGGLRTTAEPQSSFGVGLKTAPIGASARFSLLAAAAAAAAALACTLELRFPIEVSVRLMRDAAPGKVRPASSFLPMWARHSA